MNNELVAHILAKAKVLAPDRIPAMPHDDESAALVLDAWAEALGAYDFPPALWSDAVTLWAATVDSERMATPSDLIRSALAVRDRWERDPEKSRVLEQLRVERANRNYARAGLDSIVAADLPQNALGGRREARGAHRGMQRLGDVPIQRAQQ